MRVETALQAPSIDVELGGLATANSADRVRTRILTLGRYAPRPMIHATVRFSSPSGRTRNVVIAHATLSMSGAQLVAFGTGTTIGVATDRVRMTLRRQLLDLAHGHRGHHRAIDPYTSDDLLALVRHVTRMPACASREQAVFELEQLDQNFGLYTDDSTGRDAAVWRTADGGHEFAPEQPVILSEAKAVQRLALSGEQHVFFTDERAGRGRIAYRRGDHRFGLVIPAS